MCPCDIPIKSIPPSQILSHQLPKKMLFFFPHVQWNVIHLDPMCLCNAVATQLAIDEGMIGLALFGFATTTKKKSKFTHRDLGKTPLIQQYQIRIYQQLVYLWLKHTKIGISPPKKWILRFITWPTLIYKIWSRPSHLARLSIRSKIYGGLSRNFGAPNERWARWEALNECCEPKNNAPEKMSKRYLL